MTDIVRLKQVLINILSNAVKFNHYGGEVQFLVEETILEDHLSNYSFVIKDNGVGISEKDINRVFEKGFTGENGRRFGKSTGIGLYLCKKLCDKLGIGIELTSKVGEGTEVKLNFPIGKFTDF